MRTALSDIIVGQAFASTRPFLELARFHTPFDHLCGDPPVEQSLRRTLDRDAGAAVIGRPGSGKSSVDGLAAHAAGRAWPTLRTRPARIGGESDRHRLGDPRYLGARVIGDLAASYLTPDDAAAVRARGAPVVRVAGASDTVRAQLGGRYLSVSREIRQTTDSFDLERTPEAVLAVVAEAVNVLSSEGVSPVLFLDDADGLLNLPRVASDERAAIAEEFFDYGLSPLVAALRIGTLLAAQPRYEDLAAFRRFRENFLDTAATLPAPARFSEDGLRLLIDRAIGAAGSARPVDAVFSPDAMSTLLALRYSVPTVRSVMNICRQALIEADDQGRDAISERDVAYGAGQVLDAG